MTMTNERTTALTLFSDSQKQAAAAEEKSRLSELAITKMSDSTRRAYENHIKDFLRWGIDTARWDNDFHAEAVLKQGCFNSLILDDYITHLKTRKTKTGKIISMSTITQIVAAVRKLCIVACGESPTSKLLVKERMSETAKELSVAATPKKALTKETLKIIVESMGECTTPRDIRDKTLLLLGFAGAFRRSELVALKKSDLELSTDKTGRPMFIVHVRKSKTNQKGKDEIKAITCSTDKNICPVRALKTLLESLAPSDEYIFQGLLNKGTFSHKPLTGQSVATIVKDRAKQAGIENTDELAGHSLRRGFITSAIQAGANERQIMNQTGHRSVQVMRRYIERENVLCDNAVTVLFN